MKILALDIGGTNLKYGLFDENIRKISNGEVPSNAALGAEKLLERIFSVCDNKSFDLLGVSTAGMVASDGSIAYANQNIPNYTGVKLKEILEVRYGVKAFVLNDIAAGALAETNEQFDNFYYLALGTGVGGLMVKNGLPQVSKNGVAGQIGYLPSINGKGIIDKKASTAALDILGGRPAKELFEEAECGNENAKNAKNAISEWAKEVMHVISLIIGFFDPENIVIGGGVSKQGEILLKYLLKESSCLPEPYREKVRLYTANNPSGITGAAKYALRRYKEL